MASHRPRDEAGKRHRDPRVALALERTLLAWVRTAVSLVGLGVVLAKFSVFLARLGGRRGPLATKGGSTRDLGAALVVAGGLLVALAAWRHVRAVRHWRRGQPAAPSTALALATAVVVVLGAAYALFAIVR
jgi:putative membrane protein